MTKTLKINENDCKQMLKKERSQTCNCCKFGSKANKNDLEAESEAQATCILGGVV